MALSIWRTLEASPDSVVKAWECLMSWLQEPKNSRALRA